MPKGALAYDVPSGHVYEYDGDTLTLKYWDIDEVPRELRPRLWEAWIEDNEFYCPECK